MKSFALIGAAGYIAPRHLKAIKNTNNVLLTAFDPFDSVGIMDRYFPAADFFVEFERFDRHIDKLRRNNNPIDYVSVCSPNYLHDSHIRFGLRSGADVICEKPIVLNPWNIEPLEEIENETGKHIFSILQLRLHPSIIELRKEVLNGPKDKVYDIDMTYITSRGNWYFTSWKGAPAKSGGIGTNIGVHFFDMLTWIFGPVENNIVHIHSYDRASGFLELASARVKWFLSISEETIPQKLRMQGKRTYRSIEIEGKELEFSDGFTDLHTTSYEAILAGQGFRIGETKTAIEIVHDIRHITPVGVQDDSHPFAKLPIKKHPFK